MDISTLLTEYGPLAIAVLGVVAGAGWALLKLVAPFTKTKADDKFIAEHGDEVQDVLDKLEK